MQISLNKQHFNLTTDVVFTVTVLEGSSIVV